jgi:UMF1 family MFS transporter
MAAIYGTEIFGAGGKDVTGHLIGTFLLVQFVGVPFTLLWSKAAKLIGAKHAVLLCLAIYAGICVLGYFMSELWHFYLLGIAVASVQGGTQALSRSLYARLIPKGQESEFFGFYNISGKFAGIVGPLLFPIMVGLGASSRDAILALIAFFALGGLVLATVKIPSVQYQGDEVANPDATAR